jgi:hypothetical protein
MLAVMDRRRPARVHRIMGAFAVAATVSLAAMTFGGPVTTAGAQTTGDDQTWVGQVEKHGRHYDYIGRSCPIESPDPCPDYTVRYQIVPTTTQAARALPKVAGHRARLIGHRELVREPGHNGTLVVNEVQSSRAPSDPVTGRAG